MGYWVEDSDSAEVEDLWDVTIWLANGICIMEFGYFKDEMEARVFATSLRGSSWVDKHTLDGSIAWLDAEAIVAMEIGHPRVYEAKRRKAVWPEGYSPSWESPENDNPDVSKPLH